MQIDSQVFLPLAERAGAVCVFDIESSGTKGDYNNVLVVSIKPLRKEPVTFAVNPDRPGWDKQVVKQARDMLHNFQVWVSYYGKGFDVPMLQSRLLVHGLSPLQKQLHIDLYWHIRAHTLTARRSMAHISSWLETQNQKLTLSPTVWNLDNPERSIRELKRRCEADCAELEDLYHRTKHLIVNITR